MIWFKRKRPLLSAPSRTAARSSPSAARVAHEALELRSPGDCSSERWGSLSRRGGLAVGAHGHLRFTKDVDIVVELIPDNIERAFTALATLGYRPNVPVTMKQFADASVRESWVRDKGMQVLQFWSDAHRETSVDVFVCEPFPFEEEYDRALVKPLHDALPVRFVSLPALIEMKQKAGRPQDLADIEQLRSIQGQHERE